MLRFISAALIVGGLCLAPVVGTAQTTPAPKTEKKCDPKGKECKTGKDCKPENCKPGDPKKPGK